MKRLKEWGPLIALAGLMLASQWHVEQRIEARLVALEHRVDGRFVALEQQVDDGDRRIEGRLVALDQRVNGLAERIARVEGLLPARAAEPEPAGD